MASSSSTLTASLTLLLFAGVAFTMMQSPSSSSLSLSAIRSRTSPGTGVMSRRPRVSSTSNLNAMKTASEQRREAVQLHSAMPTSYQPVGYEDWKESMVLPKVYVYDHCPFCVRVRMIYGLKKIRHDLIWLQNDDKKTPSQMHPQQKKVLPIVDNGGKIMIESMDIVKAVDNDPMYGAPILNPSSGRTDYNDWVKSIKEVMGRLSRPRYIQAYLPEFAFQSSRDTFVLNHPIDKKRFSKGDEGIFQEYEEALTRTGEDIAFLNNKLVEVEDMIYGPHCVTEGGISYDDIEFFARFRGLTLIKGLRMGPKLTTYLDNMAKMTQVPLYTAMAI